MEASSADLPVQMFEKQVQEAKQNAEDSRNALAQREREHERAMIEASKQNSSKVPPSPPHPRFLSEGARCKSLE